MTTIVGIRNIGLDDNANFIKSVEEEYEFQIHIYDSGDEVGMWVENTNPNDHCTLMFDLSKDDAIFLGKSLIAIGKSLH